MCRSMCRHFTKSCEQISVTRILTVTSAYTSVGDILRRTSTTRGEGVRSSHDRVNRCTREGQTIRRSSEQNVEARLPEEQPASTHVLQWTTTAFRGSSAVGRPYAPTNTVWGSTTFPHSAAAMLVVKSLILDHTLEHN